MRTLSAMTRTVNMCEYTLFDMVTDGEVLMFSNSVGGDTANASVELPHAIRQLVIKDRRRFSPVLRNQEPET